MLRNPRICQTPSIKNIGRVATFTIHSKYVSTTNTRLRQINTSNSNTKLVFYLNGKRVALDSVEPATTLIHYLRNDAALTGTKLTCGEGGCGACTVTLSHWDHQLHKPVHRAVNSCLVPLCYVDGMEVTTVEGIGSTKKGLHPVQERLAVFGGSQCGFCTPGFVMSMYTSLRNNPHPTSGEFQKCMDGNLCRCTGYRPIVDAAKSFCVDTKDTVKPPGNQKFEEYNPHAEKTFPEELKHKKNSLVLAGDHSRWYAPTTLQEILQLKHEHPHAKVINGSTELGIDIRFKLTRFQVYLSPVNVPELNKIEISDKGLTFGAAVTLTKLYETLKHTDSAHCKDADRKMLLHSITDQLHWFAGTQIRNVASLGGNVVNASPISDLNPVWLALDAQFKVSSSTGPSRFIKASEFFLGYKKINMEHNELFESIHIPWSQPGDYIEAYKQSKRREDDIAIVTAALRVRLNKNNEISLSRLAYGGMAPTTVLAKKTQEFLVGKKFDWATFDQAVEVLRSELHLTGDPPGGMAEYRTALTLSFFFKFWVSIMKKVSPSQVPHDWESATMKLFHSRVPVGHQEYHLNKRGTSVGDPETHLSATKQVSGEAIYTDDIPKRPNEVYASFVTATKGHARIKSIDATAALQVPGVVAFYSHKDVPQGGSNLWGDIVHDEELFASEYVQHYAQPIGVIVAESDHLAKSAAKLIKVEYEELEGVYSIADAIQKKTFFEAVHGINSGNVDQALSSAEKVITGEVNMSGQEQFYFEPMITVAVPEEDDMIIYSSTQNANKTQKMVASTLGMPINRVVCRVGRIGGGFGGKETRNINISCAAALAAHHLNRPVRLLLERDLDMGITGGRHPFHATYKVGFNNDGKFLGADLKLYSNGGISSDLSFPVLDRALLFCDGCYNVPNLRNEGRVCKTNLPSNTAFRGFGGPQGQMITEAWVEHVARTLNKRPEEIREINLYNEGEKTYYGTPVTKSVKRSWFECKESANWNQRLKEIEEYNQRNRWRKRGITLMPSKYGIAFTANFLNQGGALVNVYLDGTVLVTHGGVEMGQGLHTKVAQVVASEFGIPVRDVHIKEMATDKVPNASPTAASMGSDIYGMAALNGARQITERLKPYREKMPHASFEEIVHKAYFDRVNLSAQGFFKSEHEGYDIMKNTGNPWRYFTLGTACTEVEVDCLTGDHKILRTDLVVDVGNPINPAIDIGQIEGAFMQGAGLVSIEELMWGDLQHPWVHPRGRLQTAGPGAYKIPSADDIPTDWRIKLLKDTTDPRYETIPVQSSKAVGEPPLLLGMSVFFAIKDAIIAARKQEGLLGHIPLDSPLSSERIRMACVDRFTEKIIRDPARRNFFKAKGSF